jgi:hypothetical protein
MTALGPWILFRQWTCRLVQPNPRSGARISRTSNPFEPKVRRAPFSLGRRTADGLTTSNAAAGPASCWLPGGRSRTYLITDLPLPSCRPAQTDVWRIEAPAGHEARISKRVPIFSCHCPRLVNAGLSVAVNEQDTPPWSLSCLALTYVSVVSPIPRRLAMHEHNHLPKV